MKVAVIRSNRKTVAIQVNYDLSVTVRAPRSPSEKDIEEILKKTALPCEYPHPEDLRSDPC